MIHHELMQGVRGRDKALGAFRTDQNWIGPEGATLEEATYIPPDPLTMQDALGDLERYIGNPDEDPIVQAAVLHAQFEIIHPFRDGNGRVGRMLIPLLLTKRGLVHRPVFYLSEYLEADREHYIARLRAITEENDWEEWIRYFLHAVRSQADLGISRVLKIVELYNEMKLRLPAVTRSAYTPQILDFLFETPVFSSSGLTSALELPRGTVARFIHALIEARLIERVVEGAGSAPAIYLFRRLLDLTESST